MILLQDGSGCFTRGWPQEKAIRPREHACILAFLLAGLESTHQPRWNNSWSFGSCELCGADMWLSFVVRYEEFSKHSLWQDFGARAISSSALTAALKGIRLAYHRQVQAMAEKGKP